MALNEKFRPRVNLGLGNSRNETWIDSIHGSDFVCFKNERGEIFHYKQPVLRRGKPKPMWNTIEEFPRDLDELTLENASWISGLTRQQINYAINNKRLKATLKRWKRGPQLRHGRLIKLADLQDFLARNLIERYKRQLIDWDIDPKELLGGTES